MQLELNLNSIEEKWDANWYERFSKFACNYGMGKKTFKKEKKRKKTHLYPSSLENIHIIIWNYTKDNSLKRTIDET
jgi:hypothetical protein